MTQQEMEFPDLHVDETEAEAASDYRGYRSTSKPDYIDEPYQRQTDHAQAALQLDHQAGINPTFMMQMRLGLMIISLLLWVIVFFGAIWVAFNVPVGLARVVDPLVFCGLGVFTVLTILGNFFFDRR